MTHRIAFAACLALLLPSSGHAQQDQCDAGEVVIRFSHVVAPKGHPKGEAATELARRVNAELDGRACMIVYPNSELFTDDDVLGALQRGDAEMAAPSLSKFESLTLSFRVFDLPFLFDDIWAVERFQSSPEGQALMRSMESAGILGLTYWHNGMKQLSATVPLRDPTDAAGLRFRIQNSDVLAAQFEALDAEPVRMAFRDVYDGLAAGTVDGQENTWSNIYTKRFYELQDGITETNHGVIDYLVIVSASWWNGLDPSLRADLEQILIEVTHEYNRFSFELGELAKIRIRENGGVVRRLSSNRRQLWVAAFEPVWDRFAPQIGPSLIEAARTANDQN